MKIKRSYLIISAFVVLILVIFIVNRKVKGKPVEGALFAHVVKAPFSVTVETSGELEAKNTTKIYGPSNLRMARVYEVKINDIVDEGTVVEEGDFVAQLDPSGVDEVVKNEQLNLENKMLDYESAKIDTAIDLQKARNNLENLLSEKEERKLELEKSVYEPPVTVKQAKVALEKAERNYEQSMEEYDLMLRKAQGKVRSAMIQIEKIEKKISKLEGMKKDLTVFAPKNGMIIYSRDWNGTRKKKGSMVNTWDPVVAELPDMRYLISKTFVNEVDIRKIKVGQKVMISFDAFPEKEMEGTVIKVANVGEILNNSDAKVFRVDIEMIGSDPDLRPGMSTSNIIITKEVDEALYVPIESVFSESDSMNYVYIQQKFNVEKKEVRIGSRNEQYIEIEQGLKEGDKLLFLPPDNADELELISLTV